MAQGGGNQRPIFNIPITVRVDSSLLQSTFVEGDRHYGHQTTNIIDSNIGEVVTGAAQPVHDVEQPDPDGAQHGPDEPPDDQDDDDVNVAEEMQQINLATNRSTTQKKPTPGVSGSKSKTPKFENASKKTQKSEKDKEKCIEAEDSRTSSLFTQTPAFSSSSSFTQTTAPSTSSSSTQTLHAPTVTQGTRAGATTENVSGASGSQTASTGEQIDDETRLKINFLREQSTASLRNSKPEYEKATKLLKQLTKMQHESDFYTMLQLAECYLLLGRNGEANETIEIVRILIMTSQTLCANDIKTLAEDLAKNSAHTRAVILFPIACDMFHANASSPDDAVNRMYECIKQMHLSVKALVNDSGKPRQIAASGIRYQEQMYESLSSVKNAEPGNKVFKQAWAVCYIGNNYDMVGEHVIKLKLLLSGVELLQQHFKGKESMYQVYGLLLNNIGVAHENLGNFTEAEKYYLKSVDAKTEATDYLSEGKKQEDIEFTKNNLKIVRGKLGKKQKQQKIN